MPEEERISGRKGSVDGLVGVTHPHPVIRFAGQVPQDILLERTAVLSLVLEDNRDRQPASTGSSTIMISRSGTGGIPVRTNETTGVTAATDNEKVRRRKKDPAATGKNMGRNILPSPAA